MVALSVTVSQGGRLPVLAYGKPAVHRLARQIGPSEARTGVTDSTDVLRNPHITGREPPPYLAVPCESEPDPARFPPGSGCLRRAGAPGARA